MTQIFSVSRWLLFLISTCTGQLLSAQGHIPVLPDLSGEALLTALQNDYSPGRSLRYNETRDTMFAIVDIQGDSIYGIYSDWPVYLPPNTDPTTAVFQNGNGLNTEHAWPRTFGAENDPAQANLHHLFPSRPDVNQARGNLIFGDIDDSQTERWYYLDRLRTTTPASNRDNYSEYRANVAFEPREAAKGNIARAMFYFYTIYRNLAEINGPGFFEQQRSTLCVWHLSDPVDAREWARTMAIAAYQRDQGNPFVLDCTLAIRMYCPEFSDFECITTSTDSPAQPEFTVKVSPTPSQGTAWLSFWSPARGDAHLSLYNLQGQEVATYQQTVAEGEQNWAIELPGAGYWVGRLRVDTGHGQLLQNVRIISR